MKFKRITSYAIVVLALGVGVIAYLQPIGSRYSKDEDANFTKHEKVPSNNTQNIAAINTKVSHNKIVVDKHSDEDVDSDDEFQFFFTPEVPSLWPLDTPKAQIELNRRNQIQAWNIDIKRELIDSLTLGKKLNLYIPQTKRRLTITLKSIKRGRYSESRIASIDGSAELYSAYFTLGEASLYGTIETPEGIFHLEKRNAEDGVIYAASEIRKGLDYSVSDAVSVSNPESIVQ